MILVTGGARSGKSDFARELVKPAKDVVFIATYVADSCGTEMAGRIRRHKAERPRHWQTIEEGRDLSGAIKMAISSSPQAIIVDCLTLWVSNLLLSQTAEEGILDVAKGVASLAAGIKPQIVFVTNEVGAGIVPENGLARRFRDLAGMVNRIFAAQSQSVYMLVCGAPLKLSL